MKLYLILFFAVCSLACKKSQNTSPVPDPDPVPQKTNALAKGINLSNWFNDYSDPSQFGDHFTDAALQLIKAKGFTYVRIPIGSTILSIHQIHRN